MVTPDEYSFVAAALSGCFLLSALLKLMQPTPFRTFLNSVVGSSSLKPLSVGLPATELIIGALLLTPLMRLGVAAAAATLAGAFVVVSTKAARNSDSPGCGCFGAIDATTPHWLTLSRATLVAAASTYLLAAAIVGGVSEPGPIFGVVTGLVTGVGVMLSLTLLGHVAEFRHTLRPLLFGAVDQPQIGG